MDRGERNKEKAKTMNIPVSDYYRGSTGHGTKAHVYHAFSEILCVSGLGDTRIVYSWKKSKNKSSFIVLLCSDENTNVRKIIEYYSLRWQIEIFFRELKSHLGLEDFTGQDFKAYERYVDLCLISFLTLENYRLEKLQSTKSCRERACIKKAYITTLKCMLQTDTNLEAIKFIREHPQISHRLAA